MINSSPDLYKMDTGTYILDVKSVDIPLITHRVITDLKVYDSFPGIDSVVVDTVHLAQSGNPYSPHILGDEFLSYSMLSNVIRNALEASQKGDNVTVTLEYKEQAVIKIHN